jgi:hypothetical protein
MLCNFHYNKLYAFIVSLENLQNQMLRDSQPTSVTVQICCSTAPQTYIIFENCIYEVNVKFSETYYAPSWKRIDDRFEHENYDHLDVMPCSLIGKYQCFGGICCLHLHDRIQSYLSIKLHGATWHKTIIFVTTEL